MNRDEVKNEIEDILSNNGFLTSDAEDFFNAMSDMLAFMADQMEVAEPYATNTINAYRQVGMNLGSYDEIIDGSVS